jgi:DNA-binding transcriptional regulator YiaG
MIQHIHPDRVPLGGTVMSTFAIAFKDHVRRLARKEIKGSTGALRRSSAQHRRDIAALKRVIAAVRKELARETRQAPSEGVKASANPMDGFRFSARSVRAQRKRLGLSAADFGRLVGASTLTIYHWEHGKARPRPSRLAGFMAIREIGKREALKRLEEMKPKRKGK